jgi:hypothetical protein
MSMIPFAPLIIVAYQANPICCAIEQAELVGVCAAGQRLGEMPYNRLYNPVTAHLLVSDYFDEIIAKQKGKALFIFLLNSEHNQTRNISFMDQSSPEKPPSIVIINCFGFLKGSAQIPHKLLIKNNM